MKPRIAICLEHMLLNSGGVEALVRQLVAGLSADYEILLVSNDPNQESLGPYRDFINDHIAWSPSSASRTASMQLAQEFKNRNVDVAHFHGSLYSWGSRIPGVSPILAASKLGIPCLATFHATPPLLEGFCGALKPLWFKLALFPGAWLSSLQVLLNCRCEIAVSDQNLNSLQQRFFPWKNRILRIYHSAIHPESERELELNNREPIILNVGAITANKGQLELVRAFIPIAPKHPSWKIVLVGWVSEPSYPAQIKQELASAGLIDRVIWAGEQTPAEVEAWMAKASVFAFPSFSEGLPLALQEALYRGCVAIASSVNGIPELITHEQNGLLVPPGSVKDLSQGLDRLLSNSDLRLRFASEARPSILAKGMTRQGMLDNYRAVYESILGRNWPPDFTPQPAMQELSGKSLPQLP